MKIENGLRCLRVKQSFCKLKWKNKIANFLILFKSEINSDKKLKRKQHSITSNEKYTTNF